MSHRLGLCLLMIGCAATTAEGGAPGGAEGGSGAVPSGGGGSIALGGGAGSGGGLNLDAGQPASGGTANVGDSGCAAYSDEATQSFEPADVIWAVDTSCSMVEEAGAVQSNMAAFSQQIVASGIDVHVVLLSDYGALIPPIPGVCVPAPLGSGKCPPFGSDSNLPRFWHQPFAVIESVDAAKKLVQFFPQYKFMLRPGVKKYLVVVTDDDSKNDPNSSGDAGKYDNDPSAFIADFSALDPMMAGSWKLSAIYAPIACPNATHVGTVWNKLVTATGGVHGDICACPPGQPQSCAQTFQKVFDELAKKIISGSKPLACDWAIPPPEPGKTLDPTKVNVDFIDGSSGAPTAIFHVADASKCDTTLGGWYYDDNQAPKQIKLCPTSCKLVSGAGAGSKLSVKFGCATLEIPA